MKWDDLAEISSGYILPWYILHLMVTCATSFDSSRFLVVFHSPIAFLMKALSVVLMLHLQAFQHPRLSFRIRFNSSSGQIGLPLLYSLWWLMSISSYFQFPSELCSFVEPCSYLYWLKCRSIHIVQRQIIGQSLNGIVPFEGCFMMTTVQHWLNHAGWVGTISSWFICAARYSWSPLRFFFLQLVNKRHRLISHNICIPFAI